MEELDIATIKKKALKGVVALVGRTFFIQVIGFGATFLLTVYLTPSIFGIFYVVSAFISFLSYFSDIGLAAALIQKKEALTEEDLKTTFTIQQSLVLTLCVLMFIASPYIGTFYNLDSEGVFLLKALILSFFLSSLKTIPSVLLERKLDFNTLVIPQIIETIGFYGVAVVLAARGLGIMSFTWAVLTRAVTGLIAIYICSPWRIRIGISRPVAGRLLRFGIPFQLNSVLALIKDDLMTIFLGKILPFGEVGYIGWAKKWAEVPLRLIMDSVIRVTFPAFSRLQHTKEVLGSAIEKTMFGLALTIIPISVGLLFFVGPIVSLIPKYGKWQPALFAFSLFVISSLFASFSTPLTNAINAIGKIKITLYLMIFWTAATWIFTLIFVHFFGYNGFAMALLTLSLSTFIVIAIAKRYAPFSFIKSVRIPVLAGLMQGMCYFFLRGSAPYAVLHLVIVAGVGAILYGGVVWLFEKDHIMHMIRLNKTV